jgi:hypothetical protein
MKLLLIIAFFAFVNTANAQLPNEKFGKPSSQEWEFSGWGDGFDADAVILCKTMKATYQISDQVANFNRNSSDVSSDNISDFGKNQIDEGNILIKYEFRLRTKILKPEGSKHANIDITYFSPENENVFDELTDLKVRVFSKNEKGKVERKNVNTASFVSERVDDNYIVVHIAVPEVQAGSIIEYQYNITSPRPVFLYDWVFQDCIPTVRSKFDIDIPAFLQFNMNVPINQLIKTAVKEGRLTYDTNRPDLKKGKSFPTNHYTVVGDFIFPADQAPEVIAPFTGKINMPDVTLPAYMPEGRTHLKIK